MGWRLYVRCIVWLVYECAQTSDAGDGEIIGTVIDRFEPQEAQTRAQAMREGRREMKDEK